MRTAAGVVLVQAALLPALTAQSLSVYSEFRRVGPGGEIVEADRTGKPREILSPGVARNAYASLRLAVSVPAGKPFTLHVGENPEGIFRFTLYRELVSRQAGHWIPDRLEKVTLPYQGVAGDPGPGLADRRVHTFWLDVWVPRQAPLKRVRVEAQLNVGDEWMIYPMEFRVLAATVPALGKVAGGVPQPITTSAQVAIQQLQAYICGGQEQAAAPGLTLRHLIRRNAAQDMVLARALEPAQGEENLRRTLLDLIGAPQADLWCGARLNPNAPFDPEKYLKIRDFLYKVAVK